MGPAGRGRQTAYMQKIYIVEDSPVLRERLGKLLNSLPDTLVYGGATTASEAIAAILKEKPDVVLLDLCLERSSGFDVLSKVRELEPEIDVYMLSNFASEPYRRHAERLGAAGFFDKSTEFERVREVIAQRAAVTQVH
jgi:DNA-binding NarL/FixJ family response regulator